MTVTPDDLRRSIARDPRQWGTPFEQQKKTLARVTADPTLYICQHCRGEQGYITIFGRYVGCPVCEGRGVRRRLWSWLFGNPLPMPPSFYFE